jgi:hypothetical protein
MTFAITPRNLIALSAALMALALVFAVLNNFKVRSLRADVTTAAA